MSSRGEEEEEEEESPPGPQPEDAPCTPGAQRKQPGSAGAGVWSGSRAEQDIGAQLIGTCVLLLLIAGSCCSALPGGDL